MNTFEREVLAVLTQTSTPCFVLLFGIMLEIAYYRKIRNGESLVKVSRRILQRSLWCYLGYSLTVAIDLIIKRKTPHEGILSLLFLGDAFYGDILKFWTVALMLAIPLLYLRHQKGLMAVLALSLSFWIFVPWLNDMIWPPHTSPVSYWTGMFFGKPDNRALISLLHAAVFIVIGMILGEKLLLEAKSPANSANLPSKEISFEKMIKIFLCLDALLIFILLILYGPRTLLNGYTTVFRKIHHWGYYCISSFQAFIVLLTFSRFFPPLTAKTHKIFAPLVLLGQHSLLAFTLGNIMIMLWPTSTPKILSLGFLNFGIIIALLIVFLKMKEYVFSSVQAHCTLRS